MTGAVAHAHTGVMRAFDFTVLLDAYELGVNGTTVARLDAGPQALLAGQRHADPSFVHGGPDGQLGRRTPACRRRASVQDRRILRVSNAQMIASTLACCERVAQFDRS